MTKGAKGRTKPPATDTQRQKAYLTNLKSGHGKRVVVDLPAEQCAQLLDLLRSGYGKTQAEIVRRALAEAYARTVRKA